MQIHHVGASRAGDDAVAERVEEGVRVVGLGRGERVLKVLQRDQGLGVHAIFEGSAFAAAVVVFMLAFHGLAYSLYPWLVLDRMTIWQAAAAPESLMVILAGTLAVLPMIIGYSIFAYRVFAGKAGNLEYY